MKLACVVPQTDNRFGSVMFVSKGTQARSAEREKSCCGGLKSQPSRGKHAKKMTARENEFIIF
jgi:hypothetical protein